MNLIYKPGYIHSVPDALLYVLAFNTTRNADLLHEVLRRAWQTRKD